MLYSLFGTTCASKALTIAPKALSWRKNQWNALGTNKEGFTVLSANSWRSALSVRVTSRILPQVSTLLVLQANSARLSLSNTQTKTNLKEKTVKWHLPHWAMPFCPSYFKLLLLALLLCL